MLLWRCILCTMLQYMDQYIEVLFSPNPMKVATLNPIHDRNLNLSQTFLCESSQNQLYALTNGLLQMLLHTLNIVPPPPQPAPLRGKTASIEIHTITQNMLLTQEYVSSYHTELAMISQTWEEERRGEERWYDNWRTAVQKVKELYAWGTWSS